MHISAIALFGLISFAPLSLAQNVLTAEQGCRFSGTSQLKISTIAGAIQAENDGLVEAHQNAQRNCRAAGWKVCDGRPQYSKIVSEFFSSLDQFKAQYSATVESWDCYQTVQDSQYRNDLQVTVVNGNQNFQIKPESHYKFQESSSTTASVKSQLEDQCNPRSRRDLTPTALSESTNETSSDPKSPSISRNNAISGDCYGSGRRKY